VGCFGGHGLPEASQQSGQLEEIPRKNSGRNSHGDGASRDSRVAKVSKACIRAEGGHFECNYHK